MTCALALTVCRSKIGIVVASRSPGSLSERYLGIRGGGEPSNMMVACELPAPLASVRKTQAQTSGSSHEQMPPNFDDGTHRVVSRSPHLIFRGVTR